MRDTGGIGKRGIWKRMFDLIYPGRCHRCGAGLAEGRSLCEGCAAELPSLGEPFCRQCGEEFEGQIEGAFECSNCRDQTFSFEFARPALPLHPDLLEMIHDLKYARRIELGNELGRLAGRAFEEDPRLATALAEGWPLVPVPLHRRRLLWRQFNQAEEIARPLSRQTGLPLCRALVRTRRTDSQTSLSRAQRLNNLRGAFDLSRAGKRFAAGKPLGAVLVDDVFTTGATTSECARVLRKAGIQKVVVVTVMRG
ncbi:ComF family protein [Luteolibacter arcticus]|uniref:ComF family protein n=1 Tax=Luteolibacter arcticus TaxID=1581411 RepID=A0ABT3GQT1_9BACT|nr:ComF family protein [Luteolibacter arcticus]MCW1925860.1 ComF family protein [Luteolibacter arcticus]